MTNNHNNQREEWEELVKQLNEPANWLLQKKGEHWKDATSLYSRLPFEAATAIEALLLVLQSERQRAKQELFLELLMRFNDYETPITMTAEDVRNIIEEHMNEDNKRNEE